MQTDQGCFGLPKKSTPAGSEFYVATPGGHGSTGTCVRTWSLNVTGGGGQSQNAISYIGDAILGDRFQINEPGLYFMEYSDLKSTGVVIGITVNEPISTLSSSVLNVTGSARIAYAETGGNYRGNCSTLKRLYPNDIVRVRDDGASTGASPQEFFRIVKVCD